MDAEIHSVDTKRRDSEGNILYVRGGRMELVVKRDEGLAFGGHKDQHYVEVQASSCDGATQSTLTARLNADELQRLFDLALKSNLIDTGEPTDA
jgi:hypothetical protein